MQLACTFCSICRLAVCRWLTITVLCALHVLLAGAQLGLHGAQAREDSPSVGARQGGHLPPAAQVSLESPAAAAAGAHAGRAAVNHQRAPPAAQRLRPLQVHQAMRQESRTGHLPQCQSATAAVAACGCVVVSVVTAAQQIKVKSETIAAADCVTVAAVAKQRCSGVDNPVEIKDGAEQSCQAGAGQGQTNTDQGEETAAVSAQTTTTAAADIAATATTTSTRTVAAATAASEAEEEARPV